jgi:hypothetical protein
VCGAQDVDLVDDEGIDDADRPDDVSAAGELLVDFLAALG